MLSSNVESTGASWLRYLVQEDTEIESKALRHLVQEEATPVRSPPSPGRFRRSMMPESYV